MKSVIGYAVPASIIALAIPLALGLVPPNETYGFRTSLTLSSPESWYKANRVAGWITIVAMAATIGANSVLSSRYQAWPEHKLLRLMTGTLVASLLVALAASLFFIRP